MGIFNKEITVEKKKPLFSKEAQEKARQTKLANKMQREKELQELQDLRVKSEKFNSDKRKLENDNEDLKRRIEVLESKVVDASELDKKTIEISQQEAIISAKESALTKRESYIQSIVEKSTEAEDNGYKKGYADGLSDGVRKGTEYSQEDRRMLAQVAAMAAASHTPAAAEIVAKEFKNALPATTRTKNK